MNKLDVYNNGPEGAEKFYLSQVDYIITVKEMNIFIGTKVLDPILGKRSDVLFLPFRKEKAARDPKWNLRAQLQID